jgi:hypothetical protein
MTASTIFRTASGREPIGVQQALLRSTDNFEDIDFLVPPHLTRREDAPLLWGVPEVEPLGKPRGARVAFEQSEREGVECHNVKVHRRWQL